MSKKTESAAAAAEPHTDLLFQIQEIRGCIAQLHQRIEDIDQAPAPLEEASSSWERKINLLADEGLEKLDSMVGMGMFPETAKYAIPDRPVSIDKDGNRHFSAGGFDNPLEKISVHLFRDELIAAGRGRLVHLYQQRGSVVVPFSERQAEMEKTRRDIFALEVREEAMVEEAEAKGLPVSRRPDVTPEAVLGVELDAVLPFGWGSEKFECLEAALEGADAERVAIREKLFDAKASLVKIEARIDEEENNARHYSGPLSEARAKSNRREKDEAIAKVARLGKLLNEKQEACTEKIAVVAALREYIKKHQRHQPPTHDGPPAEPGQFGITFHHGGPPGWFTGSR